MNLELFLGRFHPLVVHLPIGFILLAAIMEVLSTFLKGKFKNLDSAISIALLCGAFGAIASATIGYLLSLGGGYDEDTLFWHKWLGISLGALCLIAWFVKNKQKENSKIMSTVIISTLVLVVSITGHLGGNLTHGSEYLFVYAPEFVQKMVGSEANAGKQAYLVPANPDSIIVYDHLIAPILKNKCIECHGTTKANGGLMLTNEESISKGGDGGAVLVANNALESELFIRTTLPEKNKKFMPPKGEALSFTEVRLIEWWISQGASFDETIKASEAPDEIKNLLLRDFAVDISPKSYYDLVTVDPLPELVIEELLKEGFSVNSLSFEHPLLSVKWLKGDIQMRQIEYLRKAKDNITWLDLSEANVSNEMLKVLSELSNLTILKINKNPITDQGIEYLASLQHLEVLNLYSTGVSNQCLSTLKSIPSIKRLHIWQTKIDQEGITVLTKDRPTIEITGLNKSI